MRRLGWSVFICILWAIRYSNGQHEVGDIDLGCQPGSYRHGNFCYTVWPAEVTYFDAEVLCGTGGGILAPVRDEETQKFLLRLHMRMFLQNYWFGLDDRKKEGDWIYADNTSISTYNRWYHHQPDDHLKVQDCGYMWMRRNLKWDDGQCTAKFPYICEYNVDKCGNRFPSYGPSCFELSKNLANYQEAETDCRNKGGMLAVIKTDGTYNFLKKLIYAERYWINLTDTQMQSIRPYTNWLPGAWIGVQFFNNHWTYSDETPLAYTNWAPDKPDCNRTQECVKLLRQLWDHENCGTRLSFICQYPVYEKYRSLPDNIEVSSSNDDNVIIKGSFSVEVSPKKKTFLEGISSGKVF